MAEEVQLNEGKNCSSHQTKANSMLHSHSWIISPYKYF